MNPYNVWRIATAAVWLIVAVIYVADSSLITESVVICSFLITALLPLTVVVAYAVWLCVLNWRGRLKL